MINNYHGANGHFKLDRLGNGLSLYLLTVGGRQSGPALGLSGLVEFDCELVFHGEAMKGR